MNPEEHPQDAGHASGRSAQQGEAGRPDGLPPHTAETAALIKEARDFGKQYDWADHHRLISKLADRLEALTKPPLDAGDFFWLKDDPELCYDDLWELWDECNGRSELIGPAMCVTRCDRLSDVWITAIPLAWDKDGEIDETDIQAFATEAEADAAFQEAMTKKPLVEAEHD